MSRLAWYAGWATVAACILAAARPLPRHMRRRLRDEAARIRLDAEIRKLEKEAGL